ncbi:MAG: hypothetical protein AAF546_10575 [Verrucomicrobiota bacterium]
MKGNESDPLSSKPFDSPCDPTVEVADEFSEEAVTEIPENVTPKIVEKAGSHLTVEAAKEKIGTEVLKILKENFNGEIVAVRVKDDRDLIF